MPHAKPAVNAWLIRKRKERGWKPADVALRLDVAEVTVRGWESGRSMRADTIDQLERLFGEQAPGHKETAAPEGTAALFEAMTRAIEAQAVAFSAITEQMQMAGAQSAGEREAIVDALADLRRELTAIRSALRTEVENAQQRNA